MPNNENQKALFTELYLQSHAALEKYCRAILYNEDDAKDLMCETVRIAYEKFPGLRETHRFRFFLFGIASRVGKKTISRKKTHDDILAYRNLGCSDTDPSSSADVSFLYKAIEQLPGKEKEILALFELSGFSLNEISAMKEMNINTVKTHLSRARTRLSGILNPQNQNTHT